MEDRWTGRIGLQRDQKGGRCEAGCTTYKPLAGLPILYMYRLFYNAYQSLAEKGECSKIW